MNWNVRLIILLSFFAMFYVILLILISLCSFLSNCNEVLPILAGIYQIMHLFLSAAFAHLFSVFSSKVKIILSKYSAIVIHNLLVKSLIVNNCVVGLGLTCARFSRWKDSYFSLLAQLSEPKSNPRPKMKENVSYRKTSKY